jgi:hypothetical protein
MIMRYDSTGGIITGTEGTEDSRKSNISGELIYHCPTLRDEPITYASSGRSPKNESSLAVVSCHQYIEKSPRNDERYKLLLWKPLILNPRSHAFMAAELNSLNK